jgi:hypothetical protein
MASSPNEHLDEISLSIIRRDHEIDVSANDEAHRAVILC